MQNNGQQLDIIAIISAAIATFSAFFAFWQARIAKKALKLQSAMYEDGKVNFLIRDIENSFLYNKKEENSVYYFFKIVLSNLSDKSTSISKLQLSLSHNNTDALIVSCTNNLSIYPDLFRLDVPINIQPHSSNSGWVTFEINKDTFKGLIIDTHFIIVTDIHDVIVKREEISVREEVIGYDL